MLTPAACACLCPGYMSFLCHHCHTCLLPMQLLPAFLPRDTHFAHSFAPLLGAFCPHLPALWGGCRACQTGTHPYPNMSLRWRKRKRRKMPVSRCEQAFSLAHCMGTTDPTHTPPITHPHHSTLPPLPIQCVIPSMHHVFMAGRLPGMERVVCATQTFALHTQGQGSGATALPALLYKRN